MWEATFPRFTHAGLGKVLLKRILKGLQKVRSAFQNLRLGGVICEVRLTHQHDIILFDSHIMRDDPHDTL
jgi:hypothetical protein